MKGKQDISVFIVVALQSEATPIIEKYKLKAIQAGPFRQFYANNLQLIVSGMGRVNAAAATAALMHGRSNLNRSVCLNIGIAGHQCLPLGESIVAHHITDSDIQRSWYPPLVFNPPCSTSALRTINTPSTNYPDNTALDMEASSFYSIATRYISSELVQVFKVVSDGPQHAIENLDKRSVSKLISNALPDIEETIDRLKKLALTQYDNYPVDLLD